MSTPGQGRSLQSVDGGQGLLKTLTGHLRPFQTIWDHIEPFWTIMDHFGPYWTLSNHFGPFEPFWTVWNHGEHVPIFIIIFWFFIIPFQLDWCFFISWFQNIATFLISTYLSLFYLELEMRQTNWIIFSLLVLCTNYKILLKSFRKLLTSLKIYIYL